MLRPVLNYRYSAAYGSREYSLRWPDAEGHDPLPIKAVHRLARANEVFVEIPLLTPAHQVHLHLPTAAGQGVDLFITVHRLAEEFREFAGYVKRDKQFILAKGASTVVGSKPNPWAMAPPGRRIDMAAASSLQFDQRVLKAKPAERLSLHFHNPDALPHNWMLVQPGKLQSMGEAAMARITDPLGHSEHYIPLSNEVLAYTDMVDPQGKTVIHFDAPLKPGSYPFLCSFPGHWQVMNGTLEVVE
jgi:azurin